MMATMVGLCLWWVFLLGLMGKNAVVSEGASAPPPPRTIYEALKSHGLPMGLLPKGVTDFKIDERGRFEAHLDKACNAKFESQLHYDRNVTGTLSYGQIGALSGISAQELFLWFPVKGIRVDVPSSGRIYFDVGVVYKQFSLSRFESPPDCTEVARAAAPLVAPPMYKGIDMHPELQFGFCPDSAFSMYLLDVEQAQFGRNPDYASGCQTFSKTTCG